MLFIECLKLGKERTDENMKLIAFDMAKNYLISFTPYKKSQVALVSRDKPSNRNIIF